VRSHSRRFKPAKSQGISVIFSASPTHHMEDTFSSAINADKPFPALHRRKKEIGKKKLEILTAASRRIQHSTAARVGSAVSSATQPLGRRCLRHRLLPSLSPASSVWRRRWARRPPRTAPRSRRGRRHTPHSHPAAPAAACRGVAGAARPPGGGCGRCSRPGPCPTRATPRRASIRTPARCAPDLVLAPIKAAIFGFPSVVLQRLIELLVCPFRYCYVGKRPDPFFPWVRVPSWGFDAAPLV
jgi:hypothetical protein